MLQGSLALWLLLGCASCAKPADAEKKRPAPEPSTAFALAGTVSSSRGLRKVGLYKEGIRQEQFESGESARFFLVPGSEPTVGPIQTTYFVQLELKNTSSESKTVELEGYFLAEAGDLLRIKTTIKAGDKTLLAVDAGKTVAFHLDTDGHTTALLKSARHRDPDVPPGLSFTLSVKSGSQVNRYKTELPAYLDLQKQQRVGLSFKPATALPDLAQWQFAPPDTWPIRPTGWGSPGSDQNARRGIRTV